jgi:NADH-quinone oxidoreductase subunit L
MEGGNRLEHFLAPVFEPSYKLTAHHVHHLSHATEYLLMGISVGGALIAIVIAWNTFSKYEKTDKQQSGLGKFFENKWYIDELYDRIIVQPVLHLAKVLNNFVEKKIIDGIVNGVGRSVNYGSRQIRLLQNGQVSLYVLLMVIGLLLMFIIQFLSK